MAYGNYRFRVEIAGITQTSFSEVRMPKSAVGVIRDRGGNEPNPAAVSKSPGLNELSELVLKWGITDSMELYNWYRNVVLGNLTRKNISVIIEDDLGTDGPQWNFTQAYPTEYKGPYLNAGESNVAIETLRIVFEDMERVS